MPGAEGPITIGMPVYNAESVLDEAIRSILRQTCHDFRLVISDNASTDRTRELCEEHARADARIDYVRQPKNLGAEGNFDYLLKRATSKYFMWAAADDTRSDDFLRLNFDFLEASPDFVSSTCPVQFKGGEPDPVAMGDATLAHDTPAERIAAFFGAWHANGRYYALFRREAMSFWPEMRKDFLGSDWAFSVEMLRRGKMNRLSAGFLELGRGGISGGYGIFSRYRSRGRDWVVPFYDLTRHVLRVMPPGQERRSVARHLLHLNYSAFKLQIRYERERKRTAFGRAA